MIFYVSSIYIFFFKYLQFSTKYIYNHNNYQIYTTTYIHAFNQIRDHGFE